MSPTDSNSQLAFLPLPGSSSLLGTGRRPLSSFVPSDAALATRGGLLLVRLYPHDDDPQPNIVRLAVCNPLAGTWEALPELDCDSRFGSSDSYSRDIIPNTAGNDDGPAFRVLMIGADKHRSQFNLHAFVSGEAAWRAPVKCFDMMERQIWYMESAGAVGCGGHAHWLCVGKSNHFHVLNVDVEAGRVSLTRLLRPTEEVHLPPSILGYYGNRANQSA